MSQRLLAGLLALAACQSQSCATLEDVDRRQCGNRVVEEGEDCDGDPAKGVCGTEGTEHECKYIWVTEEEDCFVPYIAGADHRCRKPSFVYRYETIVATPGVDPQIGDFEGDGVPEVALTGGQPGLGEFGFTLTSLADDAATPLKSLPTAGRGAFADLTGDGHEDVSIGFGGLSVFRSLDGAFDLKFYPDDSFPVAAARFKLVPSWLHDDLGTVFGDADLGLLGLLYTDGAQASICLLEVGCAPAEAQPLGTLSSIDRVAVDSSDRDMVISADRHPEILHLTRADAGVFPPPAGLLTIRLQGDAVVLGGARLADVTGDGLEDLVALGEAADAQSQAIYVLPAPWVPTDVLTPWVELGSVAGGGLLSDTDVVVSAELNGDGVPDFLVGSDIFVSRGALSDPGATPVPAAGYYRRTTWLRQGVVAVGDVNGDGLDDLVGQALSSAPVSEVDAPLQNSPVQILLGGQYLPLVAVEITGPPFLSYVSVVDFDGDGASDIVAAFAPEAPTGGLRPCNQADQLVVAFGRVGGFPEEPRSVGRLAGIDQIVAGRFYGSGDGFGDFMVTAVCGQQLQPTLKSAFVAGNRFRLIANPLTFDPEVDAEFTADAVFVHDLVVAPDDTTSTHADVVVAGFSVDAQQVSKYRAFVLPSWGEAEIDTTLKREMLIPEGWAGQVAADQGLNGSSLDLVGTGERALVATARNDATSVFAELTIQSLIDVVEGGKAVEIATVTHTLEAEYFGSTFVNAVHLNPGAGALPDFAVVYGSSIADLPVGIEGMASDGSKGGGEPTLGMPFASTLVVLSSASSYAPAEIVDGFEPGDSPVEIVISQGLTVVVGRQNLYVLDLEHAKVVKFGEPFPADARGAAVFDYNDDGLDDIFVVDGFYGHVLQQLPANASAADLGLFGKTTGVEEPN